MEKQTMPPRTVLAFLLCIMLISLPRSEGEIYEEWCVADEQVGDKELQKALDWACGEGGADCSKIQKNQPCFLPNTLKDHASFAFNNYYQKFKRSGASCYFNSAAMVTDLDPSYKSCKFEFLA